MSEATASETTIDSMARVLITETAPEPPLSTPAPLLPPGFEWACVEVFGHRRHFGRCIEEERFGGKMLRVDVPTPTPEPTLPIVWTTHYYGGAALFSYTPTDEATVMRANEPYVSPYAKRIPLPRPTSPEDDDEVLDGIGRDAVESDDDRPF